MAVGNVLEIGAAVKWDGLGVFFPGVNWPAGWDWFGRRPGDFDNDLAMIFPAGDVPADGTPCRLRARIVQGLRGRALACAVTFNGGRVIRFNVDLPEWVSGAQTAGCMGIMREDGRPDLVETDEDFCREAMRFIVPAGREALEGAPMTLAEIVAAKTPATWRRMLSRWPALTRLTVDEALARLMRETPGVKGGGGDGS